jgi:hypothetical protein
MKTVLRRAIGLSLLVLVGVPSVAAQPFLSDLSATAGDPLYTTYAAPLERSTFAPDQGYQFRFFRGHRGLVFKTAQAGNLSMAFKMNGTVRYFRRQMNAPPVITASYPDLVTYRFQPYRDVQVRSTFQVYSSQLAIQKIAITNNRSEAVTLDVYPFFQRGQGLRDVSVGADRQHVAFEHGEPAEGYTRRLNLPHADSLANVFMLDAPADAFGVYGALGPLNEEPTLGKQAARREANVTERGTVRREDGSLCRATPPEAGMVAFHNGSQREILTEGVPNDGGANIPGDGTQQLDLTRFNHPDVAPDDSFEVVFRCGNEQGSAARVIPENTDVITTDISLAGSLYVPPPRNLSLSLDGDRTGSFVQWAESEGVTYNLYRRTQRTPGRFDLIADSLERTFYFDSGLDPERGYGYVVLARDTLTGRFSTPSEVELEEAPPAPPSPSRFFSDVNADTLNNRVYPKRKEVVALQRTLALEPGEGVEMRVIRGVARAQQADSLLDAARALTTYEVSEAVRANETLYRDAPVPDADNAEQRMTYWSAMNLLRQSMLPAEGQLARNYFVNAREPTGGARHAGQMMRESIAMLSYALLDPSSAQQSQRVYAGAQRSDGYIPHRVGPYVSQTVTQENGERTSAAPWFNWINAEIYAQTEDQAFLEDVYAAGVDYYRWWTRERDADEDGLSEWSGAAALESTREGESLIWNEVGAPENVEALDLNAMLVREARALATMAEALGKSDAAVAWNQRAERRAQAVRDTFWNAEDEFFYHVDRADGDFSVRSTGDLRHREIIGFLPLWAEIASEAQAQALARSLANSDAFARPNGVPSLAATDIEYNPRGRWNGSAWLPWQYLVFRGLLNYGYDEQAKRIAERATDQVTRHLQDLHVFWKRYSPDADWPGAPKTYVGAGIAARMMKEAQAIETSVNDEPARATALQIGNHPNPFRSATTITYQLRESGPARLSVHDVLGRRVATLVDGERQQAGRHAVVWRPEELPSGLYFGRLCAGGETVSAKIVRVR